jgi:hypothetical protein
MAYCRMLPCATINAKQAQDDEGEPGGVRWLVPGEIEEVETGSSLKQRIRRH